MKILNPKTAALVNLSLSLRERNRLFNRSVKLNGGWFKSLGASLRARLSNPAVQVLSLGWKGARSYVSECSKNRLVINVRGARTLLEQQLIVEHVQSYLSTNPAYTLITDTNGHNSELWLNTQKNRAECTLGGKADFALVTEAIIIFE